MKKIVLPILFLTMTMFFTLFINNNSISVYAEELSLNQDLNVKEFEDERVAPIDNAEKLKEEELNSILLEIGHSKEDVDNYSIKLKKKLVGLGGIKVKIDSEELSHKLIVDGEDVSGPTIMSECKIGTPNGHCTDGKWNSRVSVYKIGETSTQYEYMVQYNLNWTSNPFFTFKDKIGIHWGGYGQPVNGSAYGESALIDGAGTYHYFALPMDLGSNYGYKADFKYHCVDQPCTAKDRFGSMMEIIRISKNQNKPGEKLTVSAKYIHPHAPNNISLGVGYGGISISGTTVSYDDWTWRTNFTLE